jgi:hypothetical protein
VLVLQNATRPSQEDKRTRGQEREARSERVGYVEVLTETGFFLLDSFDSDQGFHT